MPTLTRHFVTLCVAIAAACLALALFAAAELPAVLAGLSGLGAFSVVMAMRGFSEARRRHAALVEDVADDRSVIDALIGRADAIEARLKTAEARLGRSAAEETAVEIATLSALVKDLADNISSQEARIGVHGRRREGRRRHEGQPRTKPRRLGRPASSSFRYASRFRTPDARPGGEASLARADAAGGGCPGRRASPGDRRSARDTADRHPPPANRHPAPAQDQGLSGPGPPADADGRTVSPVELDGLPADGRFSAIDEVLLLGAVQIVRRLAQKNRELMLVCGLSRGAAHSAALLDQALELFSAGGEGLPPISSSRYRRRTSRPFPRPPPIA